MHDDGLLTVPEAMARLRIGRSALYDLLRTRCLASLTIGRVRRIRFHDLRHSTATLLLEQGVELVVIKELLGHAHIGVTATVYAHVRLRLQRNAIDLLGRTLHNSTETTD
ncbi:tyrosine-type recombinase/integrase [Streptomyces sp. NPDC056529]|uniref:tyrosine-type recombinase/integrase n=1 Tax=Streptomyces sp. NPDC056529 TaxID=3345855 RepID=UPI00368D0BDE